MRSPWPPQRAFHVCLCSLSLEQKLRCRRNYGPYEVPVAFVKGKVAVYVDMDKNVHRAELEEDGWVILKFTSDQITDGEEQAILIRDTVKEQMRDMKKTKKKK